MSTTDLDNPPSAPPKRPFIPRNIHRFSVLIILGWLAITIALTVFVPPLEKVEAEHLVSLTPNDAPSIKALLRLGDDFKSTNPGTAGSTGPTGAAAMIVLEGDKPLGDDARQYYSSMIRQLRADPKHVLHIQDYWGDPLTQAAAISADGKAASVELTLAGNPGQTLGNQSIKAVRDIIGKTHAPPGVKSYLTGPAAVIADMGNSGDRTIAIVTLVSIAVILITLLLVYRSIVTVVLLLLMVFIELQVARGTVAFMGDMGWVGLTTYAVNLLVSIGLAAGTDYGIFFVGRYQEARQAGEDKLSAFFTTYHGTAKVVLASGLTIAGAVLCLSFTRLPYFQPLGVPCAVGIGIAVAVALTLVPAMLALGGRFGLFEPKRRYRVSGWRRIGTAIVRWPAPILVATIAVTLIGLLALPGFKPSYNDQAYLPKNIAAVQGLDAAGRHFPKSRMMMPEILLVEADHDMRDPADFLILNKLAKGVLAVPGISRVQAITRPEGTPIEHSTIPYLLSLQQGFQQQTFKFQEARMNDLLTQANDMAKMVSIMKHMYELMSELNRITHEMTGITHQVEEKTNELRDHIADFEDFFRPLRSYFYWEKHCYDIPICFAIRSVFDTIDGIDQISEKLHLLVGDLDMVDILMPQLIAQFPPQIAILESMRTMLLTMHSTMSGIFGQMDSQTDNSSAMGQAFDASKNDDSFYLPPAVFKSPGFKEVMNVFISPNGKTVRMFISQRGDPATPEGISRVDEIKSAAEEALKGTPLEDSKIYLTGTAAITKDLVDGSKFDLLIAGVASLCLILIIMLIITRSFIASLVIVGTVLISLGASFGLSVLVWQYLLGTQIHWMVVAMSVIVLLAVGSDYNLLLVSRMKEEIHAGLNTGIIRAMGGTGRVVTNAGLVFAFTMASMIVSDLRVIGQVGTTIGMGLLFDTLIVRAFMTPSIAALLGRWFWWPQRVRPRPASSLLRSTGPRPVVRALLLGQGQQR
ncbi:membrane protein [Mycobacterium rhizamassiliense]|uniref:Membrane protein n=1 Tax=Mycobacterium rhizamassiliense TaxID=1841860 RepID=A0A2U3P003_9MYCO|nr:RND family transporter [Mycobacterium rhizamassiliense]SPM37067.1 membrane protein [Mycobacterium rhizamassiliense]